MRATLLHNPSAGAAPSNKQTIRDFREIGWTVERCFERKDIDACLDDPGDAIIVVGGDGTVSRVVKRLAHHNVPLVILPAGTANNIARALGVGLDCRKAIAGLSSWTERRLDLGTVESEDGVEAFVEGFDVGLFAHVVAERATKRHKELHRGQELIAETLETYAATHFTINVDGEDLSGQYLLAAAMNAKSFGPALALAPNARVDDGLLDVVLVPPEARPGLKSHLRRDAALPSLRTVHARSVRVRGERAWTHFDGRTRALEGEVRIGVQRGAIRVLVPATS